MDSPPVLPTLSVIQVPGRARGQLVSPLDGRYGALNPDHLRQAIAWLARQVDLAGVDYVLGIPEGGNVPAYAFAVETGLQVVLASMWPTSTPGAVSFLEAHEPSGVARKYVCGLAAGDGVLIVEDEVTTGGTVVNCVRALRAAGIRCDQVATLYAADDPAMRARLVAEDIRLATVSLSRPDTNDLLYRT